MDTIVTPGLVLKETRYKESDRILTILTPELGVISASAHHRRTSAGEAAEAGSPTEGQGAGQGESTGFRSAPVEPFADGTGAAEAICAAYRRKVRNTR